MPVANSVYIEGRTGQRVIHYPERDGKKEFWCAEIRNGNGWFMVQAYGGVAALAVASDIATGDWLFVRGFLRATSKKGRCGQVHRYVNVVAVEIERREPPRDLADEEGAMGAAPEAL